MFASFCCLSPSACRRKWPGQAEERNVAFPNLAAAPPPPWQGPLHNPETAAAGSRWKAWQCLPGCAPTAAVGSLCPEEIGFYPTRSFCEMWLLWQ